MEHGKHSHWHRHFDGTVHAHAHDHDHADDRDHVHHHAQLPLEAVLRVVWSRIGELTISAAKSSVDKNTRDR